MERNNAASRLYWISVITAAFFGFLTASEFAPMPKSKGDCSVFKVDHKPVTAFVLKPPPAPPAEHVVCPVAPKCEAQVTPEPEKVEATNTDDTKPRRRRHYRKRSYWR